MSFDFYKLSSIDSDELYDHEELVEDYIDEILEEFYESPEGKAYLAVNPDPGNWPWPLLDYGVTYIGITLPEMDKDDVHELLLDIFPRKVSMSPTDNIDEVINELLAFWNFLQREFDHPHAGKIIKFLSGIGPRFKKEMFNPANFGMAKSIVMVGEAAGYDMSNEEDMQKFMLEYNTRSAMGGGENLPLGDEYPEEDYMEAPSPAGRGKSKISKEKKKKMRNLAKSSRKKNKKKKNKRK